MPLQYTSLLAAPMPVSRARELLILEYGNHCFKCGRIPQDRPLYVDHIIPVALGGQHIYANYQLLCASCNSRKWTRVADYRPGTRCLDIIRQTSIESEPERSRWVPRPRILPRRDGEYEWISVEEAARRLQVSVSTIRRMIEATPPQLVGEREPVALGSNRTRYRVRFEASMWPQDDDAIAGNAPAPETPPIPPHPPETPHDAPGAAERALEIMDALLTEERAERQRLAVDLLAATERAARAEAAASGAERERQRADDLAETLIALRASLTAKERALSDVEAERDRLRARRWWRFWD